MTREAESRFPPSTVREALLWARGALGIASDPAPHMTAELILAHVLGWDRVRVLSSPAEQISPADWLVFQDTVQRRARGVPLQYITGQQEFYGLDFRVTPAVLIPRPETEQLVEQAVALARSEHTAGSRFVDVGTGSGCIAVAFAREVGSATGCATDVSAAALTVARRNAVRHAVDDRVALVCCDLLEAFPAAPVFDMVLCNLPYVSLQDRMRLDRTVVDHEPHEALFGGPSGTEVYERFFPQARTRMRPGGLLLSEIDPPSVERLRSLVEAAGFHVESILNDGQGLPRCIVARKRHG